MLELEVSRLEFRPETLIMTSVSCVNSCPRLYRAATCCQASKTYFQCRSLEIKASMFFSIIQVFFIVTYIAILRLRIAVKHNFLHLHFNHYAATTRPTKSNTGWGNKCARKVLLAWMNGLMANVIYLWCFLSTATRTDNVGLEIWLFVGTTSPPHSQPVVMEHLWPKSKNKFLPADSKQFYNWFRIWFNVYDLHQTPHAWCLARKMQICHSLLNHMLSRLYL